jgi:hypothetical protein|nr:MAG: hypothetical protein TU35_08955 [Thermoproteus sp. AZ2]
MESQTPDQASGQTLTGQALTQTAVSAEDLANVFKAFATLDAYDVHVGFTPNLRFQGLDYARMALAIIELPASAPSAAGPIVIDVLTYSLEYKRRIKEVLAWLMAKRRRRVAVALRGDVFMLVDGADRYEAEGLKDEWIPEPEITFNVAYTTRVSTTLLNLSRAAFKCDVTLAVKHGEFYAVPASDCEGRKIRIPVISIAGEDVEVTTPGYLLRAFVQAFAWASGRWDVYLAPGPIKAVYRSSRLTITYYQSRIEP